MSVHCKNRTADSMISRFAVRVPLLLLLCNGASLGVVRVVTATTRQRRGVVPSTVSFWRDEQPQQRQQRGACLLLSVRGGADAAETASISSSSSSCSAPTKKPKLSKAARTHVSKDIKSTSPNYRIQRELKAFLKDPPPGLSVAVGKNLRVWIVTIQGPGIYQGETFRLRISFPPQYPTVPPSVYFLGPHLPVGPHFYTNGDVCLSLLGKDWRPTMTAQSIAISILSMLASVPKKTMPMDNAAHAQNKPGQYQKDWVYHDDNC